MVLLNIKAANGDLSLINAHAAANDVPHRCFAGAIGAEEAHNLTFVYLKAYFFKGFDFAEVFRNFFHLNHAILLGALVF
jgi:hypothetical protein